MDFLSIPEIRFSFQLLLAAILGMIIGVEREYIGKAAGMRTFALVSLGSTLFYYFISRRILYDGWYF